MTVGPLLELDRVSRVYGEEVPVHALREVSLQIFAGDLLSIIGPSGSGKSTMLGLLGCLDQPSSGSYLLDGVDVGKLNDNQLAEIRNQKIGFVFQQYMLLQRRTALANVELPTLYGDGRDRRARALAALAAVGMGDRTHHKPNELSGGQQQRVAVARAIGGNPSVLLADEPTGNLDSVNGAAVMDLLKELHQNGSTIVMVTHDPRYEEYAERSIHLFDGEVVGG